MSSSLYRDIYKEIFSYMTIKELLTNCRSISKEINSISINIFKNIITKAEPKIMVTIHNFETDTFRVDKILFSNDLPYTPELLDSEGDVLLLLSFDSKYMLGIKEEYSMYDTLFDTRYDNDSNYETSGDDTYDVHYQIDFKNECRMKYNENMDKCINTDVDCEDEHITTVSINNIVDKLQILSSTYKIFYIYYDKFSLIITKFIYGVNIKPDDLLELLEYIDHDSSNIDIINHNIEVFKLIEQKLKKYLILRVKNLKQHFVISKGLYLDVEDWISKNAFLKKINKLRYYLDQRKAITYEGKSIEKRRQYLSDEFKKHELSLRYDSVICKEYISGESEYRNTNRVILIMKDCDYLFKYTSYSYYLQETYEKWGETDRQYAKIQALEDNIKNKKNLEWAKPLLERVKNNTDLYPDLIGNCKLCDIRNDKCKCITCLKCDTLYNEEYTCSCKEEVTYPNKKDYDM